MAKLVELVPGWLKGQHGHVPVVVRFCGTTQQSSSTRELLTSLCKQIPELTATSKDLPEVRIFTLQLCSLCYSRHGNLFSKLPEECKHCKIEEWPISTYIIHTYSTQLCAHRLTCYSQYSIQCRTICPNDLESLKSTET